MAVNTVGSNLINYPRIVAMSAPASSVSLGTGLLRVTSSPAVTTRVFVDGIPRDDWALNWVKMPGGSYMLLFSDVDGYTTPTSVSVRYYPGGPAVIQPLSSPIVVYANTTTEVIASFAQQGNLRVQTSPPMAATVYCNGQPMDDWAFWVNIAPGTYNITFEALNGYTTPPPQVATVTAGGATSITGTYVAGPNVVAPVAHGLLRVNTSPAVATNVYLNGILRDIWSLNWVKLSPGSYTLSFSDVYGWDKPTSVSVQNFPGGPAVIQPLSTPIVITDGVTTVVTANFIQLGSLRVETSPAVAATVSCNGHPMDDWAFWASIEPGSYTLSFQSMAGFLTPPPLTVTVTAGVLTHVTGDYLVGATQEVP